MPIKLYDPTPFEVEQEPREDPYRPTEWVPPPPPPQPFADSEADFKVTHDVPPARRGYGALAYPGSGVQAEPRPYPVSDAEGTMQVTPLGHETRWSFDRAEDDLPFTNLKKR